MTRDASCTPCRDEEAFFLRSADRDLFATFQPASADVRFGLLLIHPFGEEKKCAHRTLVETARALAGRGVATLRFDLSGCGDSGGVFADARLEDWVADTAAAWADLRRRVPDAPCGLLGLRMGAALAAEACNRLGEVAALVLWQPMLYGRSEFASDLRRVLIQQMMTDGKSGMRPADLIKALESGEADVEMDGYPISAELYKAIRDIDMAGDRSAWPKACGIVQFSRATQAVTTFADAAEIEVRVVDVRPVWIRSDFLPTRATGEQLAREAVLPILEKAEGTP